MVRARYHNRYSRCHGCYQLDADRRRSEVRAREPFGLDADATRAASGRHATADFEARNREMRPTERAYYGRACRPWDRAGPEATGRTRVRVLYAKLGRSSRDARNRLQAARSVCGGREP